MSRMSSHQTIARTLPLQLEAGGAGLRGEGCRVLHLFGLSLPQVCGGYRLVVWGKAATLAADTVDLMCPK